MATTTFVGDNREEGMENESPMGEPTADGLICATTDDEEEIEGIYRVDDLAVTDFGFGRNEVDNDDDCIDDFGIGVSISSTSSSLRPCNTEPDPTTTKKTKKTASPSNCANPNDVYMGRGGLMNRFRNGSLYRHLIVENYEDYQNANFKKEFAIQKVIKPIQKRGGRFFVPSRDLKGWVQADIHTVIAPKVMQALRDCKKEAQDGHIFSIPIPGKSQPLQVNSSPIGRIAKKRLKSKLASQSTSPEAMTSSFNHPSNIVRKRLATGTPLGTPSPKIPKPNNSFAGGSGGTKSSPSSPSPVPNPSPVPLGVLRHNLFISPTTEKPTDENTPTTLCCPISNGKTTYATSVTKVVLLNDRGHMMNTVQRNAGIRGFYHFLLSQNASRIRSVPEESEGQFVLDKIIAPIQKQGGAIYSCRSSGTVRKDVDHLTILSIAKVLRDEEYIKKECTSRYEIASCNMDSNSDSSVAQCDNCKASDATANCRAAKSPTSPSDPEFASDTKEGTPSSVASKTTTDAIKDMMKQFNTARKEVVTMIEKNLTKEDSVQTLVFATTTSEAKFEHAAHATRAKTRVPSLAAPFNNQTFEIAASPEGNNLEKEATLLTTPTKRSSTTDGSSAVNPDYVLSENTSTAASIKATSSTPPLVATRRSSRMEARQSRLNSRTTLGNSSVVASGISTVRPKRHASVTPEQTPTLKSETSLMAKSVKIQSDDTDIDRHQKVGWQLRYQELIQYTDRHGHSNVPQRDEEHAALGRFVKINRQYWNRNRQGIKTPLTPQREALLDAIGFVWNMTLSGDHQKSFDWNANIQALHEFKKKHGHCDVPANPEANYAKLRRWVEYIRTLKTINPEDALKRNGVYLEPDREHLLVSLGFKWTETVGEYKDEEVEEVTFRPPAPPGYKVERVRISAPIQLPLNRVKKPISSPSKAPVEVIKMVPLDTKQSVSSPSAATATVKQTIYGNNKTWSQCFGMLKCFKEENGHTQVPYKRFPHNHPLTVLSKFTMYMRDHRQLKAHGRPNHLTDGREKLLNDIGFEWTTKFECTKAGARAAKLDANTKSSSTVVTKKLSVFARAPKKCGQKKKQQMNESVSRKVIVDSEGTRWVTYRPLSVKDLFGKDKKANEILERPPTPEKWGVELVYESDGSNDSVTF